MSLQIDFGDTLIKAAPVAGAAATEGVSRVFGLTLHDWFYVATIAYVLIQGWALIYKTLNDYKEDNNE